MQIKANAYRAGTDGVMMEIFKRITDKRATPVKARGSLI